MHDPIARVKAMLEQPKLMDLTHEYLRTLQEEIIARRGTIQMHMQTGAGLQLNIRRDC